MADLITQVPIPNAPMVSKAGVPVKAWFDFFTTIWLRTGGNNNNVSLQLDHIGAIRGGMLARFASTWLEFEATIANTVPVMNPGADVQLFTISQLLAPGITVPLLVTPAGQSGVVVTMPSASGAAVNPTLNAINIADTIDAGAGVVDGLAIYHGFGTAAAKGSRQGLQVTTDLTSPTSAANVARNYVGAIFVTKATSSDGGGIGTEQGSLFGDNPYVWFTPAATNMAEGSGIEVNHRWEAGSSGLDKYGVKVVQIADDAVAGSRNDAAYMAVNQIGAVGWGTLFQIGDGLNASPLKATGSIMAVKGAPTIANGIDLSGATISTTAFKSLGFQVSGTGVITGNANAAAAPAPASGTLLYLNLLDATQGGIQINAYAQFPVLNLARAQGTGAVPTGIAVGNTAGQFNFRGYDTAVYATGAFVRGVAAETWGATAHGALLDFITTPNTTTINTLAMRVNASGGVGIGATAADPGAGGLAVQGPLMTFVTTVAALPAAASFQGAHMFVTDSNAASFTAGIGTVVAAGGATKVPVFSDGTNWRIG